MDLSSLITAQCGIVSRAQALDAGMSPEAVRWNLRRGTWCRVLRGIYATVTGALTEEQKRVAGALYCGAGAQISGATALRRYGVRYAPDDPRIHVLVPEPARRRSSAFVLVSGTNRPDRHARPGSTFELCSVPRAAADAARVGYTLQTIRAFLCEVVQRRLTTVEALHEELAHGPNTRSALLRRVVGELRAGVRSAPEAELRDLVGRSTELPPVLWNPELIASDGTVLPTPDGWIQEVGLAFETDSEEFHAVGDAWSKTLERHAVLATHGVLAVHFTPRQIREDPDKVLATIERSCRQRTSGFSGVTGR